MKKMSEIVNDDNCLFESIGLTKPRLVPKKKTQKRDYKEEHSDAQLSLYTTMADYREQRDSGISPLLVQIAQCMIMCGLPYRSTADTRIERIARGGDNSFIRVTFYALGRDVDGNQIPMPFGSDRTLLHFGIDRAIKLKSNFVSIDNPTAYLRAIGKSLSGKNYADMRESLRRLSGLSIVVERFTPGKHGQNETRQTLPILEAANIPSRLDKDTSTPIPTSTRLEMPCGLRFGEHFFHEINQHHVPFPWELLSKLATKPQMQDIILNLHRRSYAAKSTSLITWDKLRQQMWHDDKKERRIRTRFEQAIDLFKTAWPELNAQATKRGLLIGPPRGGKHLFDSYLPERKYLAEGK
jgi:hypothetical protein